MYTFTTHFEPENWYQILSDGDILQFMVAVSCTKNEETN